MQHATLLRRLFCFLLVVSLLATLFVPALAAETGREPAAETERLPAEDLGREAHAANELVRVSIALEAPSVYDAGYSLDGVAANADAVSYRDGLKAAQTRLRGQIESALGEPLNVKHSMTLLMNVISAEVCYGDIARIKAVPGVKDVELEALYAAPEPVDSEADEPNTSNTSTYMVGAAEAWAEGYTGAGSRIAIIDTGVDTTHQSFDADAFTYAIGQTGKTVSLFTQTDLNNIKSQLNGSGATYISAKIPYGYNYVDGNTTITHMNDTQGEHGSHVAGIAAANRFIKNGSTYADAATTVRAVGMAPDAQLFIMKVFGAAGGAYDSDYMVAIEDAIVLGCDAVNLSLGSTIPGFTYSSTSSYQAIMTKLANANTNTKLVVSISAGNNGPLTQHLTTDLYIQDVSMHTGGSPGSFINSLCTASADNTGYTGTPLTFNGSQRVFYSETSNSGGMLTSVAGSYDFVYIDAVGSADDYAAVNAAVSLSGKVVIVNRGELSFVDKGNNLISYNPRALIIANNASGLVSMALSDYTGTFPMVAISGEDAQTLRESSAAHTAGSYTYYTGPVTVTADLMSELASDNASMSSFSSWGVNGSLLMKPEITAPGGSIYSVFGTNNTDSGTDGGPDQYVLKSGTSMAAPHIAGLTGTLAQYLRENNIAVSGKTTRQIVQSLLMSTAVPMHEGSAEGPYYPILQQGAGLVNVRQAIHASSLIFMNSDATISFADGKVKAELGDRPARSGAYTYSFTIHNTASVAQTYALSTDLFTQDRYVDSDDYAHMSSSTAALPWNVTYSTGDSVTVPAGGSRSVTVTIAIPADMTAFDALYPKGAYVEGYTFVESQTTTRDGAELDVMHSIPILGFYGSWTDPSMFDNMSYVDETVYGETRVPYTGVSSTNYMTYTRSGSTNYVTGNPYLTEYPFPEDRLALRSTDTIYQIKYSLIRAAGTTGLAASKLDDQGNVTSVLSASVSSTNAAGIYYSSSSGAWQNTSARTVTVSKTVSSYGVSDGERIRVGFYAIPEYYAMKVNTDMTSYSAGYLSSANLQNVLRSNVLGRGAMVGYDFYVDDTAPTVLSAIRSGGSVAVTVQDNAYIAKLALLNGSTTLEELIPAQTAPGQAVTYSFDISGVANPNNLRVFVGDYASNETTVVPEEQLYEITASSNNTAWGTVTVAGNTVLAAPAEGYYVQSVQVTAGAASPVISGNTITVNPASDCAILVIFAAKPLYTVTFKANGVNESSATAYVNDVISLPQTIANTDIAEDYRFIGWYDQILAETTDKPVYYEPGAAYTVTADATLLALFKRVEGNDGEVYRLVTEAPDDLSGNYVISSGTTASDALMLNTTGVYYRNPDACTTFANGGIAMEDGVLYNVLPSQAFVFTPSSTANCWRIMMLSIDGTYVADSSTGLISTTNAENDLNSWTVTYNSGGRFEIATKTYPNYKIGYNTSYSAFDTIRNGTGVYLWKGEPGGTAYYTTNPVTESHEHELEYHAAAAPACTEPGNTAFYQCGICGKCFSDAAGETEIAIADTVIQALGHDYVGVVTAPTETQQGYTTYTCTRCGDTYIGDYTDPLGSDFPVHFSVPAGVTRPADMISNTNTGITLPTVEGPEGYTFLGWVLEDYNNVETCPAQILTGNYIAPEEITLKALFSWVEGEGSGELTWELVSEAPADWTGKYVITYGIDTGLYVMKGVTVGSDGTSIENASNTATYANSGVSLDGTTLTNVAEAYQFAMAHSAGDYYTIRSVSTGTYLGMNTGSILAGYNTYAATNCDWTPGAKTNASSALNATNGSYPALSFTPSYGYFWSGSATTSALVNVRFWRETQSGTLIYTTVIGEAHTHTPGAPVVENEVPATCTAAGSYDNVVCCTECGEELSRETVTVPALGHLPGEPVQENYVEPTATEDGGYDTVVCCQRCGEELSREHTVLPAAGPVEPIETTELRVFSSISVGTDMVVTFSAQKDSLTNYTKKWIEIVKHAPDGDVVYTYGDGQPEALGENDTTWQADFKHIFAKEMGVVIEARVYAEDASGQVYMSPARSTNIRDYLGGRLVATNNKVAQRVLAADMLNYGAAAQMYMDYETDHLVNEELTAAQLAKLDEYETKELPLVGKTNSNYRPEGASNILFNSVSLDNEVILSLSVRANEGDTVKVVMKDHDTGTVLETLDAAWNGASFSVDYKGIGADKMRVAYDFTAQINGVETGNTRTWSIEGYVGEIRNGNLPLKTAMANALLTYGDSAAAYFAAQ